MRSSFLLLALALFAPLASRAQLVLSGTSYTQDFNAIGSGLPSSWSVYTGANATSLGTASTLTTTAATWGSTTGGFKNEASATAGSAASTTAQNAATDRALAVTQTGSIGDPGAAVAFSFNSTGKTLTGLSLDLQQLSAQARSTTWSIQYGIGTSPTSFTTLGTFSDPGAFGTTAFSLSSGSLTALNNQSAVVFRVVALSASTGSGSRDTIGLDNFSLTFTSAGVNVSRGAGSTFTSSSFGGNAFTSADTAVFDGTATSVALSGAVTTAGLKFSTTGYALSGTASDSIAVAGSIDVASGVTATISGKITGSNSISKTGPGTLVVSGPNDFVGNVAITAGTLSIDSDANLGNTANDISLGGILATAASIILDAARDFSGSGTLDIMTDTTLTTNGTLAVGSLTLANSGTLSLQGATNSLSSLTTTAGGTITGNALALSGNVTTNASSNAAVISTSTLALGTAARTFNISDGAASSDLTISSSITSSSGGTLIKTGAGTLTLSGSNTGLLATTGVRLGTQGASPVEGGTLAINNGNAFGGSSAVAIQFNAGTLSIGSAITLPNSISLGGRSNNSVSSPTFAGSDLTISGTPSFFKATGTTGALPVVVNNNTTLAGNFAATTGTGATTGITLGGTGSLTLKGTNTALTDPITIVDTLTVNVATASSSVDGLGTGALTIQSGTKVNVGSGAAIGNTIANAGTLTFSSGSTLTWGLTLLSTTGAGTNFDQITNSGVVSLTSLASLTPAISASLIPGTDTSGFWDTNHTWTIVSSSTGTISGTALTATNAYGAYGTFSAAINGQNLDLTWTPSAIPEPSTYAAIFGVVALGGAVWHRRRRSPKPAA